MWLTRRSWYWCTCLQSDAELNRYRQWQVPATRHRQVFGVFVGNDRLSRVGQIGARFKFVYGRYEALRAAVLKQARDLMSAATSDVDSGRSLPT